MPRSNKQILYPTLIMVLFTAVMMGILAYVNELTRDRILAQEAMKIQKSVLYVLNVPVPLEKPDQISEVYSQRVTEIPTALGVIYAAKQGGKVTGAAFEMRGNALWGSVQGFIGLSPDGSQILGVDFLSHSETPGLGGRIDEAWFKDQFRGLPASETGRSAIYRPEQQGNVDAITGATLTSKAVLDMINQAVAEDIPRLKEAGL